MNNAYNLIIDNNVCETAARRQTVMIVMCFSLLLLFICAFFFNYPFDEHRVII